MLRFETYISEMRHKYVTAVLPTVGKCEVRKGSGTNGIHLLFVPT
jgi:hypothetical protein